MEESITILEAIRRDFDCKPQDIRTYSPLTLAYIGDAIYDLVIRTIVVERGNSSPNKLHRKAVSYVNARVQARMIDALESELTQGGDGSLSQRAQRQILYCGQECFHHRVPQGYRDGGVVRLSVSAGQAGEDAVSDPGGHCPDGMGI